MNIFSKGIVAPMLSTSKPLSAICMVVLCCLAGCSQNAGTAHSASAPASSDGMASVAASMSGNEEKGADDDDAPITHIDCARIFSPADVAGVLGGKVTISTYPMRDNACHFESDGGSSFNLYSGKGFTEELEWKDGLANRHGDNRMLAGVGDQAFYGNSQLQSRKDDYYCAISGSGGHPPTEALARQLGALCNKIFAAR